MSAPTPASNGIIKRQTEDYNFFFKDDGTDYVQMWLDFRNGLVPAEHCKTIREIATVDVYLVTINGRQFICKTDRGYPKHIDSKLWRIATGPFYSTQMKAINRAVNNGSNVTAEFYLVAEKRSGLISTESHIMMEYVQGEPLQVQDIPAFQDRIVALFRELHRQRMALCDVHADNIFITEQGLRAIDLSWRGMFWTGKAKDILALQVRFGIDLPDQTMGDKLAVLYVRAMFKIRYALRDLKKKIRR